MTMDDTDLRGLSAEDARAYALEFLTALKSRERDLAALAEEIGAWAKRVELAASKGAAELEAAARAKLDELTARRAVLEGERAELAATVARIREKLRLTSAAERTVDADLLLAQLQMATGEALREDGEGMPRSALDEGLASLGVDDALADLKKNIQKD